ncbi:MAG TPA: Crp/Fnr family transcriptional regulator, partial [Opitutales bacterium]|nr:Crp/Fnr family transcriptional regulator [Opitutales bacterium]
MQPLATPIIFTDTVSSSSPGLTVAPAGPRALRLEEHPFFRGLSREDVQALAKTADVRPFESSAVIFNEGDESDALFLVLEGRVTFEKSIPGNNWRVISYAVAGDFFGEIGVLSGAPRALRASASGPAVVARLPRGELREFIRRTPGPVDHLLQSIISHLHHTTRHYVDDMLQQEKMALVGNMV